VQCLLFHLLILEIGDQDDKLSFHYSVTNSATTIAAGVVWTKRENTLMDEFISYW
jgi:hypothetical protein